MDSPSTMARKNTSALIQADDFEALFARPDLHQQLGPLAYPAQSTSFSTYTRQTRYISPPTLPDSEAKSSYSRHVTHLFTQPHTVLSSSRLITEKPRPIQETEFAYRQSSYDTLPEDESATDEVGLASFLTPKEFSIPGRFKSSPNDRSSILRSAHVAEEHHINLKPRLVIFDGSVPTDFVITARGLAFEFGNVEPFFGSLSLWDAANGLKLSEDFQFQVNTDANLSIIGAGKDTEQTWLGDSFALNIEASQRSSRIYLLLIVSKTLVGDLESTLDVYSKGRDVKDKDKSKFIAENTEACKQLRGFRQQFAMAATPLFKDDGSPLATGEIRIDGFQRIKGDITSFLEEAFKADKKDKERKANLLGTFIFHFRPHNASRDPPLQNRMSTSLSQVAPFDKNFPLRVREVANLVVPGNWSAAGADAGMSSGLFASSQLIANEPVNNLYLLPGKLNLENLGSSGRNICMEVKVLSSDANPDAVGLSWMFGSTTALSKSLFVTSSRSAVWYHNKKPRFFDEFKAQLPITLTEKHHLLISFYHVNCKLGKGAASSSAGGAYALEEPIAYAAIPLLPRGGANNSGGNNTSPFKLIRNGVYSVPVVAKSSMAPKYLDGDLFNLDSELASHRGSLEFQIRVNSNIHSCDPTVDEYLQAASGLQTTSLEVSASRAISKFLERDGKSLLASYKTHVATASEGGSNGGTGSNGNGSNGNSSANQGNPAIVLVNKKEILRFLPQLLTTHLALIGHEARSVRMKAFVALLQTLVDAVEASPVLGPSAIQFYVDSVFDSAINLTAAANEKLYTIILQLWAGINTKMSPLRDVAMRFSWFLGALVVKSAALQLAQDGKIPIHQVATPAPGTFKLPDPLNPKTPRTGPSENRAKWFPKPFYDALSDFFNSTSIATRQYHVADSLSSYVAHRFTVHIASFVADLYAIVDRGHLNKIVLSYLDKMANFEDTVSGVPSANSFDHTATRCLFFKVLSQHPHFYLWNLPDPQDFKSGADMIRLWNTRHVLTSAFLDTFKTSFLPKSSETSRDLILDTLTDFIYCVDSREELNDTPNDIATTLSPAVSASDTLSPRDLSFPRTTKSRIASLYLPYVYYLIDKIEFFESPGFTSRERQKALIPFVWILKHTPIDVLARYWERDSEKRIFTMFKLCTYAINLFELASDRLIRIQREAIPTPNPLFFLQQQEISFTEGGDGVVVMAGHASLNQSQSGGSNPNSQPGSRSGTGTSTTMLSALDESQNESDHLGLLSSGMRALQVPGASGTVSKKSKRRASDLPPVVPNPVSGSPVPSLQGTMRRKGDLDLEVRREVNFTREVYLTLLDMFVAFANAFPRALKRRDTFEQLWIPLLLMLSKKQTVDVTMTTFESVYHLLPAFKVHFFAKQNSACPELIVNALKGCNAPQLKIRRHALPVLIRIVQSNFIACSNIDRFRLQATIAIIKIVGQANSGNFARIKAALARASKELMKDDAKAILQPSASVMNIRSQSTLATPMTPNTPTAPPLSPNEMAVRKGLVAKGLEELEKKIETILTDNKKMKEYEYDPETLSELFFGMSKNLEDSPDERITWLENLAELHRANHNIEECAQAKVFTAALVQSYLKVLGRWDLSQKIVPAFHLVAPNMGETDVHVSQQYHSSLVSVKDEVCQSSVFSSKGFGTLLAEACQQLKEGGFYESCAASYRMILPTYYENDNYLKQKECYAELQWLCQQLLDENVMKQRIFSNYYRVVVYGAKLGSEVNGVEFVYKELPTMRLMDFSEKMKAQYIGKFGEGNVVILPNTQVVKPAELDANKVFMQICNVEVHWTQEQLTSDKNTGFKQHFGAKRFVMEQPFTKKSTSSSQQASGFEDQHIRRTIFTTHDAFPHLLKRARVISKEEVELSPIECAIALIEKRTRALKSELSSSTPNIKNIQRELQGGVLTQVNAGPLAVIQTFLNDNPTTKATYQERQREILADIVSEFERSVAFGLVLNKAMTDVENAEPTQITLQEELAKGLDRLRAAMAGCTIFATRKNAKHQMDEEQRKLEAERAHRTLGDENGGGSFGNITSRLNSPAGSKPGSALNSPTSASPSSSSSSSKRVGITRATTTLEEPAKESPKGKIKREASTPPSPSVVVTGLPPPLTKHEDGKDKKKEKEKEKEKEKRKVKKADTVATTTVPVVPTITLPPPLDPNATHGVPTTPTKADATATPRTPTGASTSGETQITPRTRAASSNVRMTMTQADKDKEREEREKERLAELKAKAKKTESQRTAGLSAGGAGSPRATGTAASSSTPSPPVSPSTTSAASDMLARKQARASIDDKVDELHSKANVMLMSIPEASEVTELAPMVKTLKAVKDAVAKALARFTSPPSITPRPSPENTGDKLAFFKAVCTNELQMLKTTVAAISEAVGTLNDKDALLAIADDLSSAVQLASH